MPTRADKVMVFGVFDGFDKGHQYFLNEAKKYGISLGIPEYQVDFHPEIKEWKR